GAGDIQGATKGERPTGPVALDIIGELPAHTVALVVAQPPRIFTDCENCRRAVRLLPAATIVVVCNQAPSAQIAPINLAAALCRDQPQRPVYLWEDQASGSLVSRARAAGLTAVISSRQLQQLLAPDASIHSTPAPPTSSTPLLPLCSAAQIRTEVPDESELAVEPAEPAAPNILIAEGSALPVAHLPTAAGGLASAEQFVSHQLSASTEALFSSATASVIGVFSGRGGVGKSTVALLLAILAQQRQLRVALVDADLQFGDIADLLGHAPTQRVAVRPLLALLGQSLPPAVEQLLVFSAPDSVEQAELLLEALPRLVRQISAQRDLVIINTAGFWTAAQAELARSCTNLLFLMDQRSTSIQACRRVIDLCIKLQIPEARFHFALNGCHRFAPVSATDAAFALGGPNVVALEDGGTLVDELLALGCPWELVASGNVFIQSLTSLLEQLLPDGLAEAKTSLDVAINDRHPASRLKKWWTQRGEHVSA
ncbi:MAG: P-loop NTPase, partial [Actinomycetia bacterium]|nr:P-loop NTPase [Actinomycetes bacterium]